MNQKGHYAWDCIGELAGKRLLNMDEKAAVCRKIRSSMYKPSFAVTIAVKIMPFLGHLYRVRIVLLSCKGNMGIRQVEDAGKRGYEKRRVPRACHDWGNISGRR